MRLKELLGDKRHFYIMHLSYGEGTNEDIREHWEFGRASNLIGLDRKDVNHDWNDFSDSEKKSFGSANPNWYRQFEVFCNEMTKGDIVVIMAGLDSILGVGEISRNDYYYCPLFKTERTFFDHVRNVLWKKTWDYDDSKGSPKLTKPLMIFKDTLRKVTQKSKFWDILCDTEL
jgi:hypothetical protein